MQEDIDRTVQAKAHLHSAVISVAGAYGQCVLADRAPSEYKLGAIMDQLHEWIAALDSPVTPAVVPDEPTLT